MGRVGFLDQRYITAQVHFNLYPKVPILIPYH